MLRSPWASWGVSPGPWSEPQICEPFPAPGPWLWGHVALGTSVGTRGGGIPATVPGRVVWPGAWSSAGRVTAGAVSAVGKNAIKRDSHHKQPRGLGVHQIGYFASGRNKNLMRQRMVKPSTNPLNCLIPQAARKFFLIPLIFAVKEKLL